MQGRGSWEKKLAKKNSAENSKIPVPKNSNFDRLRKVSRKLSKGKESNEVAFVKGQIISECPYEIILYPKIATKKFPRFLSGKFTTSRLVQNKVYLLANRT